MFCNICSAIFLRKSPPLTYSLEEVHRHQKSFESLHVSASQGCYICSNVRAYLDRGDGLAKHLSTLKFNDEKHTLFSFALEIVEDNYELSIRLDEKVRKDWELAQSKPVPWNLGTYLVMPAACLSRDSTASSIGPETFSKDAQDCAERWLDTCIKQHTHCTGPTKNRNPAWYPTRLLDFGGQSNQEKSIKLCLTAESPPDGPYATLSHCWGGADILKLTTATLSDFQDQIPFKMLPKTFTDAIVVSERMKIRYLWIDSLCIIQDSSADWITESTLMDQVYQNAVLNIAATASENSNSGLFFPRKPYMVIPPTVTAAWYSSPTKASDARYQVLDDLTWENQLNGAPLNKRAWVLQERMMSPRILHFGRQQLFWECGEVTACEAFPNGPVRWSKWSQGPRSFKALNPVATKPMPCWFDLIEGYSDCGITYGTDKLVAISGIARQMQQVVKYEYFAGLWGNEFIHQLTWQVIWPRDSRPSKYQAPSWSWASVNGELRWDTKAGFKAKTELLHVEVSLKGTDQLGQVEDGLLRLRGPLRLVTASPKDKLVVDGISFDAVVWFDVKQEDEEICYALTLGDEWDMTEPQSLALLLLSPTSAALGQYSRLGLAWYLAENNERKFRQFFLQVVNNPKVECEAFDPVHGHTVTVV